MLAILSPLGLLEWPTARWVWALINTGLAVAIPVLGMSLATARRSTAFGAALVLGFIAMLPTRNVVGNGQTTLLVLAAALLAIAAASKRNQWMAGLFLGLALSKFSLTLPLVLWFLLRGLWPSVLLAAATQLAGLLILALASASSPVRLLAEYYAIASSHIGMLGGLDIPSLGSRVGLAPVAQTGLRALVLLITLVLIGRSALSPRRGTAASGANLYDSLIACSFLLNASLLLVYHRPYDAVVVILLPASLLGLWMRHRSGGPLPLSLKLASLLTLAVLGVFLLPGEALYRIWPAYESIYFIAVGAAALGAWAASGLVLLSAQPRMTPERV